MGKLTASELDMIEALVTVLQQAHATPRHNEAVAAFGERRAPKFTGR